MFSTWQHILERHGIGSLKSMQLFTKSSMGSLRVWLNMDTRVSMRVPRSVFLWMGSKSTNLMQYELQWKVYSLGISQHILGIALESGIFVFKLSLLLARRSKIPFGFIFMNIIMCLLIITIWKPCGQHHDSFNHRLRSWLVISFPVVLLMLLLPLPLLLLASWWHTQVKENHAGWCRKHTSW